MELAVQKLAIVNFFVIGLSHIIQPRAWARFFIDIREKGATGSFIIAFIHFPLGALVVAFHNVWHGLPMILTFIGYGLLLKSLVYLNPPKNTPSIAAGLDGDQFGIVGASPTINSG